MPSQPILTESGFNLQTETGSNILTESVAIPSGVGSQVDILNRLQRLMPPGWFAQGATPIRDAMLTGIANALAFVFSLFTYLKLQTRTATATDGFLDLISLDYFGGKLPRAGQPDPTYRAKIQASLFPQRNTRAAIIGVLTKITGRAPVVFEPARAADTGAYNNGTLAYGVAGGYGSLKYPYQSFVTAYRPLAGSPQFGISDADIYAAVEGVRLGGSVCWVRILN
jgi:hypothetical protein